MSEAVLLFWSGGKDSALALDFLNADPRYKVAALVTTYSTEFGRVTMHGVRRPLLQAQAARLGHRLIEVPIGGDRTNAAYKAALEPTLRAFREQGGRTVAFGDIFLEDLREFREEHLRGLGLDCLFPLWRIPTAELLERFWGRGFRARLVCAQADRLDESFLGQDLSRELVARLPAGVDPCGENGEFHTFVYDGPGWAAPVGCETGEIVRRDSFLYCDLV